MEKVKPRTCPALWSCCLRRRCRWSASCRCCARPIRSTAFYPLDTPLIESSEVLLAKGGGETEKQIYRFTKGDSDLSLRFDLTVPLAKYVAQHYGELTFPFRRYQIGKVYRGERAQRGRFREFYQADIDVIGDGKLDIINEGRGAEHHLQDLHLAGARALQDPHQQPQGVKRLFRHPRPDRQGGRRDAHDRQAREDRRGKGQGHPDGRLRRGRGNRGTSCWRSSPPRAAPRASSRRSRATRAETRCSIRARTS